jgi:hypothetical protein
MALIGVRRALIKPNRVAAAAPSKSYTYAGADSTVPLGSAWTSSSINIGAASAGRLVIVMLACQGGTVSAVSVNGVALTQAVIDTTADQAMIWYGTVASGSGAATIAVTGGTFFAQTMMVYTATGLSSNTPVGTTHGASGANNLISVNAGDFLFSFTSSDGVPAIYSGSTAAPSNTHTVLNAAGSNSLVDGTCADWLIASTNASFSVNASATAASVTAANWR